MRVQPIKQRSPLRVQWAAIYALLLREVQSRVGRSRAGFLWALIEPITHLLLPVVLFGFILNRHVPGYVYPIYVLQGLMPFLLFKNVCLQTMDGVSGSRGLVAYRQVHLVDVFVAKALSIAVIESCLFVLIYLGLWLMGFDPWPARPIEQVGVWLIALAMGLGVGMVFAAICGFAPDARPVIRVAFVPLYLMSGVMLPVSRFPQEWIDWFVALNPVLHLVELSREFAYRDFDPLYGIGLFLPLSVTLVSLFVGLSLYRLRKLVKVTP